MGTLLLERRGVVAEDELCGLGGEAGETSDGKVFVVELGVVSENLIGL